MKRIMKFLSLVSTALTVIFLVLYITLNFEIFETLAITFGVTAYHFLMRLLVGFTLNSILKNNVDNNKWWFRQKSFEPALYKTLCVKKWKNHMPTYEEKLFDIKSNDISKIIGATCQAELVHEIIIILSFLPILSGVFLGGIWVMIITSVIAALFDAAFVIMQRYNRPRLIKFVQIKK